MNATVCQHLRTKQLYTAPQCNGLFAENDCDGASPAYFWCNLTLKEIGPDDRPVHQHACHAPRACCELGFRSSH